jgi:hypothetical protein
MRRLVAAAILLFAHAAHAGEDESAPAARRGIDARLSASGDYASLVGLSFFGASAAGAIGAAVSPPLGVYGGLSYMRAETSNGLALDDGTIEAMLEGTTGRLRLGLGTGVARLVVHRVSESTTIDRWGGSAFFYASCDLWQSARGQGLFVVLRPEMQIFSTTMPRAALGLGFRF